jgi:ABC-type Fe3+/spermidine/putrescine transport system ATPase subunit
VGTANILPAEVARRWTNRERAVAIRPEHVLLGTPPPEHPHASGTLMDVQFHGPISRLTVATNVGTLSVSVASEALEASSTLGRGQLALGASVQLYWSPQAMVELEPTERS